MWKPITIKPGDQSLVGHPIRCAGDPEISGIVLFVGNTNVFIKHFIADGECSFPISYSWEVFLGVKQVSTPKKLVAPALVKYYKVNYWQMTDNVYSSKEDVWKVFPPEDYKIIFPALPNSEGWYEVEGD